MSLEDVNRFKISENKKCESLDSKQEIYNIKNENENSEEENYKKDCYQINNDNHNREDLYSKLLIDDFFYVMHFDTISMLRKKLIRNFDSKTEYPIKPVDSRALLYIGLWPNQPMKFYSDKLNLEQGSFSYVCNKIKALGLVDIIVDEEDKRQKKFILTKEGQQEVLRSRLELDNHIESELSNLDIASRDKFFKLMSELRAIAKMI